MSIDKQDIKIKIMNTAEILFAEKGYDGVSIDEIAKKAEINKAMIYYYYSSKEGLFISLLQKHISKIDSLLSSIEVKPSNNYRSIIRDMLAIAVNYIDTNTNIIKILLVETLLETPKTKIDIINFINPIWDKIEATMQANSFEFGDISITDKMLCINLIINFVTIKERIDYSDPDDFENIKKEYIERLTDIVQLISKKKGAR